MFLKDWYYPGSDPALSVFTLANPLLPSVPDGGNVLEIGSCDTPFANMVKKANPTLSVTGVDQRDDNVKHMAKSGGSHLDRSGIVKADVLKVDFPPLYFDAICSLSAIEHIGLGRYDDPIDPDGDIKTLQRVREWLKPGGWCYFDVPYTPQGYYLYDKNKCRCYDDQALLGRFGPHEVIGVAATSNREFIDRPTTNHSGVRPWWYIALLVRKEHGN